MNHKFSPLSRKLLAITTANNNFYTLANSYLDLISYCSLRLA